MLMFILILIFNSSNNYISKYTGTGFLMGVNASSNNGYIISKAPSVAAGATQTFSQVMTIGYGTNNNVGIGTTSPVKRLHVKNGTSGATNYGVPGIAIENDTNVSLQFLGGAAHQLGITFSDPTTVEAGFIYYNTSTNNLQLQAQNDIIFTQTGNVGIGTTGPSEKLQVQGNIVVNKDSTAANFVSKTFTTGHATANRGGSILFGMNDSTPTGMRITTSVATNASYNKQEIEFITHEGAVSVGTRMFINSTGNVGIGTDSPTNDGSTATTLEVRGKSGTGGGVVRVSNAGNTAAARFFAGSASATIATVTNHDLNISTNNSLKMVVQAGGDVGIGKTTSLTGHRLSIKKVSNQQLGLYYDETHLVAIGAKSNGDAQIYAWNGSSYRNILLGVDGSAVGGNVGIGTINPQAKLEIGSTSGAASGQYNSPSALLIGTSGGSAGAGGTLLFGADGSSASDIQWSISNSNTGSNATGSIGNLNFNTKQTLAGTILSPAMTILAGGNVGIGVTNPGNKLRVEGSVRINDSGDGQLFFGTGSLNKIELDGTDMKLWSGGLVPTITMSNQGLIKLGSYALTGGAGTPNNLLGVDSSGNVIKTSSFNLRLDDTPAANTTSGSGNIVNWSVSETVTAGTLYAVKTNGGWTTADADTEATAAYMLAIALGSNATAGMLLQGFFYKSSHGFTIGAPLYVSNTAGAFSNSRPTGIGDYVRIIGYATSADYIYFDPDKTFIKLSS